MMTVGELRAELDNYGDHLPVVLVMDRGERDVEIVEFAVFDGTIASGETGVKIEFERP